MTQEEKAKQYDEVLEKAKSWYVDAQIDFKKTLEALFPTIKENEDERVRKAIISGMKALQEKGKYTEFAHIPMDEVFTWLEKQGKKKLDDEVEPKFHKGEWIVFNGLTLYIKEVVNGYYRTISFDGINNSYVWDIDNIARLWTIQDARDGDVLCCESGWTCIFKTLNSDNISFSSYCFMDNTGWFCETGSESHTLEKAFIKAYNGEIYPATKEQRDLLFKKMEESGYEFDFEKKELKEIEQKSYGQRKECLDCQFNYAGECEGSCQMKREEQKPVWSEEDETYLDLINTAVKLYYTDDRGKENPWRNELLRWLKSLKERVQPQYLTITNEELVQAKKEAYNDALNKIEYHSDTPTFNDGWSAAIWYLKKRTTQPQSTWKPSEEQMSSLRSVVNSLPHEQVLFTLYNDLKKLKGE